MKKIKWVTSSLFLLSMLLGSTQVLAAEYTSNGQIKFTADTEITDPVDPIEPDQPVKPVDPTSPTGPSPGTAGPLSIDYASSLDFGEVKIKSTDEIYSVKPQEFSAGSPDKFGPNYVQVTDKRGTFEGWTLALKQDKQFFSTGSVKQELAGAAISFSQASVHSTTENATPTFIKENTLVPGVQVDVVMAAKDQGMGTWVYRFGTERGTASGEHQAVQLSVPGKTSKRNDTYTTQLNWTLKAAVANVGE